jgi:hypothetical protein
MHINLPYPPWQNPAYPSAFNANKYSAKNDFLKFDLYFSVCQPYSVVGRLLLPLALLARSATLH